MRHWLLWVLIVLFVFVGTGDARDLLDERQQIGVLVGNRGFNFVRWEADALLAKIRANLAGGAHYLPEEGQKALVFDYLDVVRDVRATERELEVLFATSAVLQGDGSQPDLDSQTLQRDLAQQRAEMAHLQPVAEAVVEGQVSTILQAESFAVGGVTWPPVAMHMTPLPSMLIISPRDHIEQVYAFPLQHGIAAPERDQLEQLVLESADFSALVVNIGGLGVYPAMIVESSNITFLTDVISHEWSHHWLVFHPVGYLYAADPAIRTINETTASIFGEEAGRLVMERYYPELLPPPISNLQPPIPDSSPENEPPPFDFRAEMRETRITTDDLLLEGKIEEAETYMEQRRQIFVDNGYLLRKINQAYFAFYGAYADSPGATGANPIGPAVITVRENTDSLREFLDVMAEVDSLSALIELVRDGEE